VNLQQEGREMVQKICVSDLPLRVSEREVFELFSRHGAVVSVRLSIDREKGRSRGFGFVEMSPNDAHAAISALNGSEFGGHFLKVHPASDG
jgi:RNA recognition motif-containing protein